MALYLSGLVIAVLALVCALGVVRQKTERVALILRLENADELRQILGSGGMAELMGKLMSRSCRLIGADLGASPGLHADMAGEISIMMTAARLNRVRRSVLRLQSQSAEGVVLQIGTVFPVLSCALLRITGANATDQQLRAYAAALLVGPAQPRDAVIIAHYGAGQVPAEEILPQIFAADRVELWFQPQLCTDTGTVLGAELEPRLRHPEYGLLAPSDFLSDLTQGDMLDLVQITLKQGLTAMREWDRRANSVDHLTLRLGLAALNQTELADILLWELDRQDVPPARLVIAIADDVELADGPTEAAMNIERLAAAGCVIELVDFGIGGTALQGLRRFGAKRLRMGESFVVDCDRSPDQQRMILAILALAEHLGLRVVAEQVCTAGEHTYLSQIGVAQVQGNAVMRALPVDLMPGYLQESDQNAALVMPLRRVG